jgi:hypothetical protein
MAGNHVANPFKVRHKEPPWIERERNFSAKISAGHGAFEWP